MHKRLFVVVITLIALLLSVSPAQAITYGQPDNGEHPYVGVVIFSPDLTNFYICSGSLIAPTVFLTAGHCADPAEYAWVSFDEEPNYGGFPNRAAGWIPVVDAIPHPDYDDYATFPNTSDIGVMILSEEVTWITPAEIAPLGFLDSYENKLGKQDVFFEAVGYGVNSFKPFFAWEGNRYKAQQRIINLRNSLTDGYNVMLTNNPGKGNGVGGTCSGDSGGPILWDDSDMIVAVNSFGIAPYCKGNDFAYRVDIQNSYDFLSQFVDLD